MILRWSVLPALLLLSACAGGQEIYPNQASAPAPPSQLSRPYEGSPVERRDLPPPPPPTAGTLMLAGVGSYMDAQESELRNRLRGSGVMITRPGDALVIVMRNDLVLDGMEVSEPGRLLLTEIAAVLRYYDHSMIQIQGFTDTTGRPESNLTLSENRARLVLDALVTAGVSRTRMTSQGFGETRLRFVTGDNVSEPRNRRIEIRIAARPG